MRLTDLPTPCALVDLQRFHDNVQAMAARATTLGVALRPHAKTHKTVEGARLQTRDTGSRLTVSTLAEARFFAAAGFQDLTLAVPLAPSRIPEAAALARRIAALHVLVDSAAAVDAIEAFHAPLSVFLEVDCGYGRSGVDPTRAEAADLAVRLARSPVTSFAGLLTHAGQAYSARDRTEARAHSHRERDAVVGFAHRLRGLGLEVPTVSVGSTPTMTAADDLAGVTEIRPGNYVFFDAHQAAVGSCRLDEVAYTVLSTVIAVHPHRNAVIIDAGALALSKDPGPRHVDPGCGYGRVLTPDHLPLPVHLETLSQEHGHGRSVGDADLAVGDRVRIVPNHACLSAACFDRYHVVQGREVVGSWRPIRGW